jgi:hypothetical protein
MLFKLQMENTVKVNRLGLRGRQFMACFKLLFAWIIEGNCHISIWPVYFKLCTSQTQCLLRHLSMERAPFDLEYLEKTAMVKCWEQYFKFY